MSKWEVVTAFTLGHCAVTVVESEEEAEALAEVIASKGFADRGRRGIIPVSQIGNMLRRPQGQAH